MPPEFETKKISSETLGEYLSIVRSQLDLTLEEVAQKTGVYEKFISYIETGKYNLLPPGVYVLGFLKKLAGVYNISCEDLINQYKKERGIVDFINKEKKKEENSWKGWVRRLTITPKLITLMTGLAIVLLVIVYVAYQVIMINRTPSLVISEPKNDAVIEGSSINIVGKTDTGMSVSINGQNIFVEPDGSFRTTIGVASGQKELQIQSENKFGKINKQVIALRVETPQVAGAETTESTDFNIEIKMKKATKIGLIKDGITIPEEIVPAGGIKQISATDSVTVTTYDAGSTEILLNGESLGLVGKAGQKLTLPFTKHSSSALKEN